ncbi:MAG: hypothetical protein EOO43_00095 [Flavobacterium sp.]|nr:MAG: hypothetical protein EOO43_00095 [Flavobacterium sp.]
MSLFRKFKKSTGVAHVEPVNHFFTEHNHNGFISKPELLDYTNEMTETEFNHTEEMFEFSSQKFKISNKIASKTDPKTQSEIIWVTFELANGTRKLRIPYHPGILRFLKEYQITGISFNADFELLLAEAGANFGATDL